MTIAIDTTHRHAYFDVYEMNRRNEKGEELKCSVARKVVIDHPVDPKPPLESCRISSTSSQRTRLIGSNMPCAIRSPADTCTDAKVKFNTAIFTSS